MSEDKKTYKFVYICDHCIDDIVTKIFSTEELKDLPECQRCGQEMERIDNA